ncbi:putative nucleotidyltransferase substrate binding domain-containing protein [Rubrivirga sp.]|uniref:putative nucleotidyltransferase substrate binding domain-containing protein n=1 Tax=Rubrivirga sp. TaxID=1885344 RepID=UPI003C779A2D
MVASLSAQIAELLSETEPFDILSDEERQSLLQKMTLELYAPGEVILQQGDDIHRALYIVTEGLVRLEEAESGRTVDMAGSGSQFGSYGLLQGGALPYEARAVEQTSCALIAAESFQKLLKSNDAFRAFFEADIKRYVRTLDDDIDASGAFLLFDASLGSVLRAKPTTVETGATVREAAQAMASSGSDGVVMVQDGIAMGVVTEGDLVKRVVATGGSTEDPVMSLVDRPPVALRTDVPLFQAIRTMMRERIRRIVVVDAADGKLKGLLTSEDVSHFRGLDPVATIERIERARSVEELAGLRADSNRRLYRLYHQGVHSEDLLDIVTEVDDHLKQSVLGAVERDVREEFGDRAYDGAWAWLTFGASGRRESVLRAWQDNGLVYADPAPGDRERAAEFYAALANKVVEALRECGYGDPENGIDASSEPFRQPLSAWKAAYDTWAGATDAEASSRAALCFDLRTLHGDTELGDELCSTIAGHLPNDRLAKVLAREGTRVDIPLSTFGRIEVDEVDGAVGLDLRARAIQPIVRMARALAIDAGYLESASTFDRLRHIGQSDHALAPQAKAMIPPFTTLVDIHLREQMRAAERGATPTDLVDPDGMHKSQQNLLKETLKDVRSAQSDVRKHYGL